MNLKNYTIIYSPTVRHHYMFQTPHQVLKEFSKRGVRSIFCDVVQNNRHCSTEQTEYGFEVCYDLKKLKTELKKDKVIYYNTLPKNYDKDIGLNTKLTIFHYLDDFEEWKQDLPQACNKADIVLTVADKLYKDLSLMCPEKLYKFNNACDFELFNTATEKPRDFPKRNNVILYYGCVHKNWFDVNLIQKVIKLMPDKTFLFIGQRISGIKEKNYLFMDHKNIKELPGYLQYSEACVIPFLHNDISFSADPLKLYEYFSAGKPVIATSSMPEVNKYEDLVYFGNTPEEFKNAIVKALKENKEKVNRRIKVAQQNSWENRIDYLQELIEKKLSLNRMSIVRPERVKLENPLISVVLPVYNDKKYIKLSIESILKQTYKNIELIIVNDGSTDGTAEILKKYYLNPKVIVIHQSNKKLPAALNTGFRMAKGDFLTWTSSDNISFPEQYETLLNYLQSHLEKGIVYSDYHLIDEKGKFLQDTNFRIWNRTDKKDKSIVRLPSKVTVENFCDTEDNFIGASFLYRREVAEQVGEYNEKYFGAEDLDYWLRMRRITEFGHLSDILYLYRVHPNSLNSRYKELSILDVNKIVRAEDKAIRENIRPKIKKNKIRVAVSISSFGTGGMEQVTNNIICGLDKNKFEVIMIITGEDKKPPGNIPPDIKKNNIETFILKGDLNKFEKVLKDKKIQILNSHHSQFGFDVCRKIGVKIFYTIHNIYSWIDKSPEFAKVDRFIAVSQACKEYFSPRFDVSLDKIFVIPNGIDVKNITGKPVNRKQLNLKKSDYIFINVGNITKVKMQRWQILAMAELVKEYPDFKLLLVGSVLEKIYYEELLKLIKIHNLQNNVIFFKNQTRVKVAELLQASDCFLLPSLIEGWSIAVMEAMYYEKPLILTEVGNSKDVIKNNDIGLIVQNPWGDIKNLTPALHYQYCNEGIQLDTFYLKNAMIYMYKNKEHFCEQGKLGKKKIEEKYLVQHMVTNYEKEFENGVF